MLDLNAVQVSSALSVTVEKVICCPKILLEIAQVYTISLADVFCFCITRNLRSDCQAACTYSDRGAMCRHEYNALLAAVVGQYVVYIHTYIDRGYL